ncbi:MAG: TrmH family RNA methyltransferase [Parasphingorhabdus sp.]|nr:TrmH family RNA methyltransferase [Parasphingorhabdus sp.]
MAFHVYILRCNDGSYYTGHTDNLETRIGQHQSGHFPGYTHGRRPVELLWNEVFSSRIAALEAEKRIKGWSRDKKDALLRGDWEAIHRLGKKTFRGKDATVLRYTPQPAASAHSGRSDERDPFVPSRVPSASEVPVSKEKQRPVIILVRPQLGQNIGKAARAMLNFGLTEMRLVAPRDGWPNPDAGPAASGADSVLEAAQVYDCVADAVADCTHVYATTVRRRGVTKPVFDPAGAAHRIATDAGRAAILFGPERSGLDREDINHARSIITVPINAEFGSLNLAQAVILVAYELSRTALGHALQQPNLDPVEPPAAHEELDAMIVTLDKMLNGAGFYYPPSRAEVTRETVRNMMTKPGWTAGEVRTMRGILSALDRPHPCQPRS